jgi:D-alanyl-lipoteichoic acid acyltransferase DltB (MBOAT superfamily)
MDQTQDEKKRRLYLIITVVLSVSTLCFFKYFAFLNQTLIQSLAWTGLQWEVPTWKILLPLGISFYTFQTLGYLFDVYHQKFKAERSLKYYLLFVSFFPTIISGPIERASNMIPQYKKGTEFSYLNAVAGLKWMLWGYFIKMVVADGLGAYVDEIYLRVQIQTSKSLLLVIFLYPLQLYCDFAGYSAIALGTAKTLGFDVMQNFKRPYLFATSITDFWRRNHISLTTWLTDYIYTPLSISFRFYGTQGLVGAILITFMIAGIWHGAGWTFLVYGLIHGIFLSIDAVNQKRRKSFEKKWRLKNKWWYILITCTYTYLLVCFSFIFFRSNSLLQALQVMKSLFSNAGDLNLGMSSTRLAFSILCLGVVILSDFRDEHLSDRFLIFENKSRAIRWSSYVVTVLAILLLGRFGGDQFIYFQF